MLSYRYANALEESLRKNLEFSYESKLLYSWEIARILHNLGMSIKTNGAFTIENELLSIESKIKRNLISSRAKSIVKNFSPLYKIDDVWNYLKECEKKELIHPILENKIEELLDKNYHNKIGR